MINPVRGRWLRFRLLAGLGAGVLAVLTGATAASAHVRVDGTDTTRGGYGVLTFRVPTESDTASTTALSVSLPTATPIVYAATRPMPGWSAVVTTTNLKTPVTTDDGRITTAVTRVTWTARAAKYAVPPGQFQEFDLAVGPLPDQATVTFPALQTYSDGRRVNWNQVSSGGAEPEHPAPVLALAPSSASAPSGAPVVTADRRPDAAGPDGSPGSLVGLGGLALGALGVVLALVALARSGRRGPVRP